MIAAAAPGPLAITSAGLTPASPTEARTGLLGWVTAVVNDAIMIDGVTLRRTQDGRLALSYPSRTDARGRRHHVVRPIDDAARREIERQVLERLGLTQEATP